MGYGSAYQSQVHSKALACLRYFPEEMPDLAVVAAGSRLEFTLSKAEFSMPVGRVEYFWLGPLTFDEYLAGQGETEARDFLERWTLEGTYSASVHQRMLGRLREFLMVGGMPEAVQAFIDSGDFLAAVEVHHSILGTCRDDFSKYARGAGRGPQGVEGLLPRCGLGRHRQR